MSATQMIQWIQIAEILIGAGTATAAQVRAFIASVHGTQMSDADLNTVCDHILTDTATRKAQALADAVAP